MTSLPIRVVTHRNWLARQFAPYGGKQDFGVDIDPSTALNYVWWAPGEWVARAAMTGVNLPLVSCGAEWVESLGIPYEWLQRKVISVPAGQARDAGESLKGDTIFVKLPEAKTDVFPARLMFRDHLGTALASPLLGSDTMVSLSEEIQFSCEARFFVAHGVVVASSWYRNGERQWAEEGFTVGSPSELAAMEELAHSVAALPESPSGYTVDIGIVAGSPTTPAIVEFNAAWSSNPYDADMCGVVEAVRAANTHTLSPAEAARDLERWRFDPNAVPGVHRPLVVRPVPTMSA